MLRVLFCYLKLSQSEYQAKHNRWLDCIRSAEVAMLELGSTPTASRIAVLNPTHGNPEKQRQQYDSSSH
jgi:hypothetical protein